jgi:septum formation protein
MLSIPPPFPLPYPLILGSASPRRKSLLEALGFSFEVQVFPTDEVFPDHLSAPDIAIYLAQKKANAFPKTITDGHLLLTADTIVVAENQVLNKPADQAEAFDMLQKLNEKTHEVYTGICVRSPVKSHTWAVRTAVTTNLFSEAMLHYYIHHFAPMDKAGAYGIQEFYGMAGVEKVEGCYYNVMGLPTSSIFQHLYNEYYAHP